MLDRILGLADHDLFDEIGIVDKQAFAVDDAEGNHVAVGAGAVCEKGEAVAPKIGKVPTDESAPGPGELVHRGECNAAECCKTTLGMGRY